MNDHETKRATFNSVKNIKAVARDTVDSYTQLMSTISMERNVSSPFRMYFQPRVHP